MYNKGWRLPFVPVGGGVGLEVNRYANTTNNNNRHNGANIEQQPYKRAEQVFHNNYNNTIEYPHLRQNQHTYHDTLDTFDDRDNMPEYIYHQQQQQHHQQYYQQQQLQQQRHLHLQQQQDQRGVTFMATSNHVTSGRRPPLLPDPIISQPSRQESRYPQPARPTPRQATLYPRQIPASVSSRRGDQRRDTPTVRPRWFCDDLVRHDQLTRHLGNWETFPKSLGHRVDELMEDITPPLKDERLRQSLNAAAKRFRDDITDTVSKHLTDNIDNINNRMETQCTATTDKIEKVKKLAFELIKNRFGKLTRHSIDHLNRLTKTVDNKLAMHNRNLHVIVGTNTETVITAHSDLSTKLITNSNSTTNSNTTASLIVDNVYSDAVA